MFTVSTSQHFCTCADERIGNASTRLSTPNGLLREVTQTDSSSYGTNSCPRAAPVSCRLSGGLGRLFGRVEAEFPCMAFQVEHLTLPAFVFGSLDAAFDEGLTTCQHQVGQLRHLACRRFDGLGRFEARKPGAVLCADAGLASPRIDGGPLKCLSDPIDGCEAVRPQAFVAADAGAWRQAEPRAEMLDARKRREIGTEFRFNGERPIRYPWSGWR